MPTEIGRDEVQVLFNDGAQVVDVRPQVEFEEEHIAGAIHLPLRSIDAASVASNLKRDVTVIFY